MTLPSLWKPKSLADFVGDTARCGAKLQKLLALARPERASLKFLLLGKPGIGKTELGNWFERQLGLSKWSIASFNGKQVGIEVVEDLARSLAYTNPYDDYRLIRFEEVDRISVDAQVRMLTLLDNLPPGVVVFATSNCSVKDLEERFQSRFTVFELKPPSQEEITNLLTRVALGNISRQFIASIAMGCCGNARQALLDADHALVA
jgi:replication-associated recombination protein RarA